MHTLRRFVINNYHHHLRLNDCFPGESGSTGGLEKNTWGSVAQVFMDQIHFLSDNQQSYLHQGGYVIVVVGLTTQWLQVRLPAAALSGNNLRQVVHTYMPLSPAV